jgi:hypothetical protein
MKDSTAAKHAYLTGNFCVCDCAGAKSPFEKRQHRFSIELRVSGMPNHFHLLGESGPWIDRQQTNNLASPSISEGNGW